MATLLCNSAEVHESIELSFWVVSGVGQGIGVLDMGPRASREKGISDGFTHHWFQWCVF